MKYNNFYVFEGLDKAGKSTLINKVEQKLKELGLEVKVIHFPTEENLKNNIFGTLVQDFLQNNISTDKPELIYQLYANDRLEQKEYLEWLLNKYDVVLCDRYMYSNLAYMGVKMERDMKEMVNYGFQLEYEIHQIPEPKKVFFLDTKEDILNARYEKDKEKADVLEKDRELQMKARLNYQSLKDLIDNYHIIYDINTKEVVKKILN